MTLTQTVTNILNKRVTDEEAKLFALNNFGILASYIRNKSLENIMKKRKEKLKLIGKFGSKKKSFLNS
jgi:hypothetical protein